MHFTIQREAFLKPLRHVSGVVERKHAQVTPILSNVLLHIEKDRFSMTTTDQEIEMVAHGILEEPAKETGDLTIPVRKLMDICRNLPEGAMLSLVEDAGRVILRSGKSRFTLSTLPAKDFPALSKQESPFRCEMTVSAFKQLVAQTEFAMADQDVRYYLNGMLLEFKQGKIYSVAADGHRLAFAELSTTFEQRDPIRVIIPRKAILELQRILEDSDDILTLSFGANHMCVSAQDLQFTSQLLEGRFPEFEKIVNNVGDKVLIGSRVLLKEAFQRAATLLSDKCRGVRLRLTDGCLKILAINDDKDEVEEDVEVDYAGSELEIGFNVRYLMDFFSVITSDQVKLTFSDPNSSACVEGVGTDSSRYIIMPMRF